MWLEKGVETGSGLRTSGPQGVTGVSAGGHQVLGVKPGRP